MRWIVSTRGRSGLFSREILGTTFWRFLGEDGLGLAKPVATGSPALILEPPVAFGDPFVKEGAERVVAIGDRIELVPWVLFEVAGDTETLIP